MVAPLPPQGPPPAPPPPSGGGGLIPEAQAFLAGVPPEIAEALAAFLSTLPPEQQFALLQDPAQLEAALMSWLGAQGGAGPVGPDGLPLPPGGPAPPGEPPPMGAPPGMPADPALMTPPSPPQMGPPPGMKSVETAKPREEDAPPKRKTPKYELPPLPKDHGAPSFDLVADLANRAERRYRSRNDWFRVWADLYHQRSFRAGGTNTLPDGDRPPLLDEDPQRATAAAGAQTFTGPMPTTLINRGRSITAPTAERTKWSVPPRSDEAAMRAAAQAEENWLRWAWEKFRKRHAIRVSHGLASGSFDDTISGYYWAYGACGYCIDLYPDDPELPLDVRPVPPDQLYPMPRGTLRITYSRLADAVSEYPEIAKRYPKKDGEAWWGDDTRVTVACYADERHYAKAYLCGGPEDRRAHPQRDQWLVSPGDGRHDLGFRLYYYSPSWNASPFGPDARYGQEYAALTTRGALAGYEQVFRQFDAIISGMLEAFKRGGRNPKVLVQDANSRATPEELAQAQTDLGERMHLPGAVMTLPPGVTPTPLVEDLMQSASGQGFLQYLVSLTSDLTPPVLGGKGNNPSGFDRNMALQSAAALIIEPVIRRIQEDYPILASWLLQTVARKGKGKGKDKYFRELPYHATKGADQFGALTPDDVLKNGDYVVCRIDEKSQTERLQLMAEMTQALEHKLISRLTAQDLLGIEDTEREDQRILSDMAKQSDPFIRWMITEALRIIASPEGFARWQEIQAQENAPPAPPPGQPSPPGVAPTPGAPAPGIPPAAQGAPPPQMGGAAQVMSRV